MGWNQLVDCFGTGNLVEWRRLERHQLVGAVVVRPLLVRSVMVRHLLVRSVVVRPLLVRNLVVGQGLERHQLVGTLLVRHLVVRHQLVGALLVQRRLGRCLQRPPLGLTLQSIPQTEEELRAPPSGPASGA